MSKKITLTLICIFIFLVVTGIISYTTRIFFGDASYLICFIFGCFAGVPMGNAMYSIWRH